MNSMMNEKKKGKFKGYLLTVIGGLAMIAGFLFLILQYRSNQTAAVMVYGRPILAVPTILVIVISALAGPVFLMCCWWLVKGIWILRAVRRVEKFQMKQADKAVSRAKAELQAAVAAATPAATEREPDKPADDNDAPPTEGEKESSI